MATSASDAFTPNADWLAQGIEPVLFPDIEIIDSHLHLGDHWQPPFFWDDFAPDALANHVVGAVYVECGWGWDASLETLRGLPEVLRAREASTNDAGLLGIVGYLDLRAPRVEDDLDALIDAGRGRLVGIRNRVAYDADPAVPPPSLNTPADVLSQPEWHRGFSALGAQDLVLDLWAYHSQLHEVASLARTYPDNRMVVDHLGGPLGVGHYSDAQASEREWRDAITLLKPYANISLKLGGIGMSVLGTDWRSGERPPSSVEVAQHWASRITFAIETLGADRCMFEGNFPVDKHALPYSVVWNTFKRIVEGASETESSRLFAGTAREVYSLKG